MPLFVALLAEGLERSIDLAESMEARGFGYAGGAGGADAARGTGEVRRTPGGSAARGRVSATTSARAVNAALAAALTLLLAGAWARGFHPAAVAGWAALGGGLLLLGGALAAVGRQVQQSRFRREP